MILLGAARDVGTLVLLVASCDPMDFWVDLCNADLHPHEKKK